MNTDRRRIFSLTAHGVRYQIKIVVALVVILPLLAFAFLAFTMAQPVADYAIATRAAIAVLALGLGASGYLMLRDYAENIVRLRGYLQRIAQGELPESVDLVKAEDDVTAIERCLNVILSEMRKKLKLLEQQLALAREMQETIKAQGQEILDAERHRVMIQSLGTACHHIGQPATVLRAYLELLRREVRSDGDHEKLDECIQATESIAQILEKLRRVGEYRTLPYQTFQGAPSTDPVREILDIEN